MTHSPFDNDAEQAMNKSSRIGATNTNPALIINAYTERLMTSKIPTPNPSAVQAFPICGVNSQQVEDAYQAYAAMRRAAQSDTGLLANDYFIALQDTAYARFLLTFEAL